MKNTFGNSITVTLFGESHGHSIGAVVDGLCPGIAVDDEKIRAALDRRRPSGTISTARCESDRFEIVSGVYHGYTTGTPLCIVIQNADQHSGDYEALKNTPRPSHADYTAEMKYHGYQDVRGGGHFSGRLTAPLVAVGAILSGALESLDIRIGTHIAELAEISDEEFFGTDEQLDRLARRPFPTLSTDAEAKMRAAVESARAAGDSVGGVLETVITGLSAGIGEPWFDSVESVLSHLYFSIPAVKGVEFGDGFALSKMRGSEANDPFTYEGGRVVTVTNRAGGINGGITNGMPIRIRAAVRPTPSIAREQKTVNLKDACDTAIAVGGRHDPTIVHRACPVADAMAAIGIADLIATRFGTDIFQKGFDK